MDSGAGIRQTTLGSPLRTHVYPECADAKLRQSTWLARFPIQDTANEGAEIDGNPFQLVQGAEV